MILQFTTCQANNTYAVTAAIANYLSEQLKLETRLVIEPPWEECLKGVLAGKIQIGWMCGYPYVQSMAQSDPPVELLALPVFAGNRYENRPIYFSDVVVRQDSRFTRFADLRGATWAYNEAGSQSGYHIVRYKLAQMGENRDFFSQIIASGRHRRSLQMVLAGEVDSAALDSTVLAAALRDKPDLTTQIRIIDVLGPSPIPPWVAHKSVPASLRQSIRQALTQLHLNPIGQKILAEGQMVRFETAVDAHYDPIRQMLKASQDIHL